MTSRRSKDESLVVRVGNEELVVRQRYEVISIINDILIGVWFLLGSILFFNESTATAGTWLFVIGSVEMLIRPVIHFARHVSLSRYRNPSSAEF